jgi:hypothetical protein
MGRRPRAIKPTPNQHYSLKVMNIYLNPRNEVPEEVLGVAELIQLEREAVAMDAYILEHEEKHNVSRSLEYWKVRFFAVTPLGKSWNYKPGEEYVLPIPIVFEAGRITSGVKSLKHAAGQITTSVDYGLEDNFEGVPGWGQQF